MNKKIKEQMCDKIIADDFDNWIKSLSELSRGFANLQIMVSLVNAMIENEKSEKKSAKKSE